MNNSSNIQQSRADIKRAFRDKMPVLTILLYHGVTEGQSHGIENFSKKHLNSEEFERQIKFLKDNCVILSIDEVVSLKNKGQPYPARSVVISFDDGFKNNSTVAAPILNAYDVPAVFYITSGIVNTDLMFWVDKVEDCINLTEERNITLELNSIQSFPLSSSSEKIQAVTEIKKHCKSVEDTKKEQILSELVEQTRIIPSVKHAKNYQKIDWEEVIALHKTPLFTIGGHSMYHSILANLESAEMKKDIDLSIDLLQFHLKEKVKHYAYPEGQCEHYNKNIIEYLKKKGVVCSPSAIYGFNEADTDLFDLRRIMVGFLNEPFPFYPEHEEVRI